MITMPVGIGAGPEGETGLPRRAAIRTGPAPFGAVAGVQAFRPGNFSTLRAGPPMDSATFAFDAGTRSRSRKRRAPSDPVTVLSCMPLLSHLPERSIRALAYGASEVSIERGATVFHHGTVPTGLYFVVAGAVKLIAQGADGRDKIIELFGPGEMFGEVGVFMHSTYRAWAQAVGRCTLIHVTREQVLASVGRDQELSGWMLTEVSTRVQKMIDVICTRSTSLAAGRVAAYLVELSERAAHRQRIEFPAPKGTVASLLSLTQETFSRIMRRLCDDGLIVMAGRTVHILDPDGLRRVPLYRES